MTAKTLAASVIAVLAITACGTTTRQSSSVGSSPTVAWASCMRSHGVPSYPDPTYDKGGRPNVPDLSSLGIDTRSPAFTTAGQACNGHGTPIG